MDRLFLGCLALCALAAPLTLWGQDAAGPADEAAYQKFVEEYFDYYERGVNDSAELALRSAIKILPDNQANFLLKANLAELVVSRKDTLGAVSLLSEALADHPEMEEIRDRRAALFEKSGRANDALADLDVLIDSHPQYEVYRYRKALVLIQERLWNGAASELELIVRNNPQGYLPRVTLAAVDSERGRELEAEQALTLLTEEYPDIHVAPRTLALFYLKEGRKTEALETIRKVINEGKVVTAEDYLTRAAIWSAYGEEGEAAEDRAKAAELGASDETLRAYAGNHGETFWKPLLLR